MMVFVIFDVTWVTNTLLECERTHDAFLSITSGILVEEYMLDCNPVAKIYHKTHHRKCARCVDNALIMSG